MKKNIFVLKNEFLDQNLDILMLCMKTFHDNQLILLKYLEIIRPQKMFLQNTYIGC